MFPCILCFFACSNTRNAPCNDFPCKNPACVVAKVLPGKKYTQENHNEYITCVRILLRLQCVLAYKILCKHIWLMYLAKTVACNVGILQNLHELAKGFACQVPTGRGCALDSRVAKTVSKTRSEDQDTNNHNIFCYYIGK